MSIAKIKDAAAAGGTYVVVLAVDLAEALKEAGDTGELAQHVAETVKKKPLAVMQVHRETHLGKLLGIPAMPLES